MKLYLLIAFFILQAANLSCRLFSNDSKVSPALLDNNQASSNKEDNINSKFDGLAALAAESRVADTSKTSPVNVKNNPIYFGQARFSVINKELIRMEYAPDSSFTDLQTIFAINRDTSFDQFVAHIENGLLIIETDAMILYFYNDGKPFNKHNLRISIKEFGEWIPGMRSNNNLGGTLAGLDGIEGPTYLGEGLISLDGWHLVDDSLGHILTEQWISERPQKSQLDWYFFGYGSDYKAALKALTHISGAVPMPRKYLLGSWYSKFWPYTSDDYRSIAREYEAHNFPLDVMVLDKDWHQPGWTGWTWNRDLLPDAEELLRDLHQQNLYVTLNLHPAGGVSPNDAQYVPFMDEMGEDPSSGKIIPFDAANMKYLNSLFKHVHLPLEQDGVDFWWLDWDQEAFTRSMPSLRNIPWLNRNYFEHSKRSGLRGQSFSRWGGWGDHKHPIHFSGDASTSWQMLEFEVPFNSTAGNVGCFFWSHDVGGFRGERNEEAFARWVQFASTTAAMRLHATNSAELDRLPWRYAPEIELSIKQSFHLRSQLFPYIYSSIWRSHKNSIPLNRPMYIEHSTNENAYLYPGQYYLGEDILVAPVTSPGVGLGKIASNIAWFPPGRDSFYNWFTGELFQPDKSYLVASHLYEFPLFVRGGVPIPTQLYQARMGSSQIKDLVIRIFPGEEGKLGEFILYEDDGLTKEYETGAYGLTRITYVRTGNLVTINIYPTEGQFLGQLQERNIYVHLMNAKFLNEVGGDSLLDVQYDQDTFSSRLFIGPQAINRPISLEVRIDVTDPITLTEHARLERLRHLLGKEVREDYKLSDYLKQYEFMQLDKETLMSIINIFGGGIVKRPNTPYNYPSNDYDIEIFNGVNNNIAFAVEVFDNDSRHSTPVIQSQCNNTQCRYSLPIFGQEYSSYIGVASNREVRLRLANEEGNELTFAQILEKLPSYLGAWRLVGPFSYDPAIKLETQNHEPFKYPVDRHGNFINSEGGISTWQSNKGFLDSYGLPINIRSLYNYEYRTAYAYTILDNPDDQDIIFKIWADDGVEMLIDGQKILSGEVARSISHGPYSIPVRLTKGKHEILLKITNLTGDWLFNVAVEAKKAILETNK